MTCYLVKTEIPAQGSYFIGCYGDRVSAIKASEIVHQVALNKFQEAETFIEESTSPQSYIHRLDREEWKRLMSIQFDTNPPCKYSFIDFLPKPFEIPPLPICLRKSSHIPK
jgi:hypothetical protein